MSPPYSIGYMGDGFYMSKDPTNSIKVLKEQITSLLRTRQLFTRNILEIVTNLITPRALSHIPEKLLSV